MTPLSAGYIAGGSNRPNWEFGELAPEKSSDRRIRDLTHTMASPRCFRIALILLLTCHVGIFCRAVPSRVLSPRMAQPVGQTSRADTLTRWKRGSADTQQERCAELAAPWRENIVPAPEDDGTLLQFRVRPFPPRGPQGLLFPGKSLFSFVRRVYRCCQERLNCRSVKGIPGRLRGGTDVEFLLTREILSLTVMRAELHLQLSNPNHLDMHPVLSAAVKRSLPTRYSLWSQGNTVELRVDLLFLLQTLQEVAGGAGGGARLEDIRQVVHSSRGDPPREKATSGALQDTDGEAWGDGTSSTPPALELGLVLGCSQAGSGLSCRTGGVHLSQTPFMAVYYK